MKGIGRAKSPAGVNSLRDGVDKFGEKTMKLFSLTLILLWVATVAYAQPSDAQIIKDLTGPNVISVTLSEKGGGKAWSSAYQQYFWERGAVIYSKANVPEYPNARVRTGGLASYTLIGTQATFKRFDVAWKDYEGIPMPSPAEIIALIQANYDRFFGNSTLNQIVGEVENLRPADDPKTQWHTPNHFTMQFACSYRRKTSIYDLSRFDALYEVHFYRDAVKSPWKKELVSSRLKEDLISKETFSQPDLAAMPTLGQKAKEQSAQSALAGLPQVTIPAFSSEMEVFLFVHRILMEGDEGKFESMMMKMMAPVHFMQGSEVLLNANGVNLINQNIQRAFKGKAKYSDLYCMNPAVKTTQPGSIEFYDKLKSQACRIKIAPFGGRYENGVKVGQTWKIVALEAWATGTEDDLARIASYAPGALCKD